MKPYYSIPLRALKALLITLFLLFANTVAFASYPLLRNFAPNDYKGATQNWDAAKDDLGRVYFANMSGLLAFDSRNWTIAPNSNYTCLRSLLYDSKDGRIYAGGTNEFGFYHSDPLTGNITYESLVPSLERPVDNIREVWNIMKSGNEIWFQSDYYLLCYNGERTKVIDVGDKIFASAFVGDKLYFYTSALGVCYIVNNQITKLHGCDAVNNKHICSIIPLSDGQIIFVTSFDGMYIYRMGRAEVYNCDINGFLEENQAFCAAFDGSHLVVGTVNCGAVIKDLKDGSNQYVNVSTGLRNNTVLNAYFDESGDIWLMMDNGIGYVSYNSPISNLTGTTNVYGAGYSSLLSGNALYLGTNQALYSVPYPVKNAPKPLELSPLLKGQVWSIDTIGSDLLVSSDRGLFQKLNGRFVQIDGVPGTWSVCRLRNKPNMAVASTYDNLYLLERATGGWHMVTKISGNTDFVSKCYEDNSGYLWTSHWLKGVYRLRLSADARRIDEAKLYDHTNGLPAERNISIQVIDDRVLASTEAGFYNYDSESQSFVPNDNANKFFHNRHLRMFKSPGREYWGVSIHQVTVVYPRSSDLFDVDSLSFLPLTSKIIAGFEHLNFINSGKVIAANQDGFYEVDPLKQQRSGSIDTIFVSKVFALHDSLVYSAAKKVKRLELPFSLNSLRFEFVSPEYHTENAIQYSYYLENYDSDWSPYSLTATKEYTHLHEGTYKLHIRSTNNYNGAKCRSYICFTIRPPWYRSSIAIIIYCLAFLAVSVWLIILLRNYSKRAAMRVLHRKEAEMAEIRRKTEEDSLRKDYEIARLKSEQLELSIKHKSEELSNTTMNVIRKNEILLDISAYLKKIYDSISDVASDDIKRRFNKLQNLIRENVSHDDDWRKFANNFDIVYENFLSKLKELHPELTTADLRLCAYLKMDLSSKEIAQLLNISYRSVEMARYRLRQKLGLGHEISLVDYLEKL